MLNLLEEEIRLTIPSLVATSELDLADLLKMDDNELRGVITKADVFGQTIDDAQLLMQYAKENFPNVAVEFENACNGADHKLQVGRAIAGFLLCDEVVLDSLQEGIASEAESFLAKHFPAFNMLIDILSDPAEYEQMAEACRCTGYLEFKRENGN